MILLYFYTNVLREITYKTYSFLSSLGYTDSYEFRWQILSAYLEGITGLNCP